MKELLQSSWFKYFVALLAAVVGYLAVFYVFRGESTVFDAGEAARLAGFLLSAGLIVALGGAMHSARRRAEADARTARERALALANETDEHRRTRASLEAKERDLQIVTDTMTAGVARCSRDMRYLWVNRLYAEWTGKGLSAEEMMGRQMIDVLGSDAMERIRPHAQEVLSGRRVEYQRFARRAKGQRWINVSMEPTYDAAGIADGWVSVIHDIDESKRAAEALREAREQLQVVTDNMPAGMIRTGNDLRLLWMNPVYERWLRKSARQLIGTSLADSLGPEQMREVAPYFARVLKGEQVHYERLADLPGLGGKRWISAVLSPVLDVAGHPDGWVAILVDIHDRKVAEDALRAADRRKDDFLATLAHELRNPLAPIRNAVAILGRKGPLDPELAWSRDVIERQVGQMSRLIDDLLDIERISRGKFLVRKERILLERAIDMALEMSRPYITAAGHRLSVLMPSERAMVEADPSRLAQVFSNLLNNAAKFTEPHGSINLTAVLDGNAAVITVEDTGIGFPPDVAQRLFKPYSQLTSSQGRSRGGLGIGLSLVHGIVGLHGGSVQAHSEGPGKGAIFTVRLPLSLSGVIRETQKSGGTETAAAPGMRVLVADDNQDAADSLSRVLGLYGYEMKVSYDGAAAIALAESFVPHIAILDIGMPGASGYEVAQALRTRLGAKLTLIALTGWGQEGDRRRAMEAGFDFHFTKPVDPASLHEVLAGTRAMEGSSSGAD